MKKSRKKRLQMLRKREQRRNQGSLRPAAGIPHDPANDQHQPPSTDRLCDEGDHQWIVFSIALAEGWLMLNCTTCGAMGTVDEPTKAEINQAYRAPSRPYEWSDNPRVRIRHTGPGYVAQSPGSGKPGRIVVSNTPLTPEERSELEVLERVVIKGNLDGHLFPLYIRSFQQHTGVEPTGAVKRLATQVEALVRKRRGFTPAMMAIVIREYLRESQ